ncbi:hypothetical protein TELCIR_01314 [Teladorsagia circumcincta]|uniref:Uncharacterized protein n=1 Tax=Teladorsagia circumcincta TaxID=45464 RepID=A0A2G9V2B5_TELCI|nr:hypothetical protein TELCIR_01314 [Teladorsagia circumcincta]
MYVGYCFMLNDIFLFTRPVAKTGARISISRPAKSAVYSVDCCDFIHRIISTLILYQERDDEPIRPPRPPPRLAAAPISISRTAKVDGSVCTEKSKPLSKLQHPKSILLKRKVSFPFFNT